MILNLSSNPKITLKPKDLEKEIFLKCYCKNYSVEVIIPKHHLSYYISSNYSNEISGSPLNIVKTILSTISEDYVKELEKIHYIKYSSITSFKYEDPEVINLTKILTFPFEILNSLNRKNFINQDLVFKTKFSIISPFKDLLFKDYTKLKFGNYIFSVNQEDVIKECIYIPKRSFLEISKPSDSKDEVKYELFFDNIITEEKEKTITIINYSDLDTLLIRKWKNLILKKNQEEM